MTGRHRRMLGKDVKDIKGGRKSKGRAEILRVDGFVTMMQC